MEALSIRLPEHIRSESLWLFVCDAASGFVAILLYEVVRGSAGGAFVMAICAMALGALIGRYRVSLAATPHEEWYAAIAVVVVALPIAMILCALLGLDWYAPIVAAVIWTLGAGSSASAFTRARRHKRTVAFAEPAVVDMRRFNRSAFEHAIIRTLDLIFAGVATFFALPLLVAIAALIASDDGLPILFSQTRVGRDERDFTLYKFRTMKAGAGEEWAVPGDSRLTKYGAFLRSTSLDELPQLWNVLRGDMSLVGPRPEMRNYADAFAQRYEHYTDRHLIRPGLTGWAQMRLPRNLQPSDAPSVLEYDLFYVAHASVYLYLFCILKTACEIIDHRGA